MARVKGKGNRSTEERVAAVLRETGVDGWVRHSADLPGRPDFHFPDLGIAVFVDGCFWHGCPKCDRNLPRTRTEFWRSKIAATRRRDRRVTAELRREGTRVMRVWEHQLRDGSWLSALRRLLSHAGYDWRAALRQAQERQ